MKAFKLLPRLFTIFGLVMTFAVSGWSAPTFSIGNASVVEGNSGTTNLLMPITLANVTCDNTARTFTVKYAATGTVGDTATVGIDYTSLAATTITFYVTAKASGTCTVKTSSSGTVLGTVSSSGNDSMSQNAPVSVKGNIVPETDETLTVTLSNASSGTSITTDTATGTILNDDMSLYGVQSGHNRPFTKVKSYNERGDLKLIGNTIFKPSASVCPGTSEDSANNNNNINTAYVNVDDAGINTPFRNSTTSNLTLPAGIVSDHILWAGLYWQGYLYNNTDANKTAAKKVQLKIPGGSYQEINSSSDKFNWVYTENPTDGKDRFYYQGAQDVTAQVKAGLGGTYTVANIVSDVGSPYAGAAGGWALIVAYKDSTAALRNLTVYDGYIGISGVATDLGWSGVTAGATALLDGFLTPSAPNDVNSTFYLFGGEGDIGSTGDSVSLSNQALTVDTKLTNTANTNVNNIFNSSISVNGVHVPSTDRNPSCQNNIGLDIDTFAIGSNALVGTQGQIIANGQTRTNVKLGSSNEIYFPGLFAFATDVYQPNMCYLEEIFKGTENISGVGKQVNKDDILTVRVTVKNTGNEPATGVQVLHQFDNDKFKYKTGTTKYDNFNAAFAHTITNATDVAGDDNFEYNTTFAAKINLGSGANKSVGGEFVSIYANSNAYAVYEYNATVLVVDQNFSNSYKAAYVGQNGLVNYSANPVTMEPCTGARNSFWGYSAPSISSLVDVVDPDTFASYTTSSVIKTKIANQNMVQLTAVNLDSTTLLPKTFTQSIGGIPLEIFLYRTDSTCTEELALAEPVTGSPAGQSVIAHIPVGSTHADTNQFVMKSIANKNSKIKAKFADWSIVMEGLDSASQCFQNSSLNGNFNGLPQCLNTLGTNSGLSQEFMTKYPNVASVCVNPSGTQTTNPCGSAAYDNSGSKGFIQPSKYNHAYGCLACILDAIPDASSCSRDNFAIRPNEFNSSLTANQQFQAGLSSSVVFYANKVGGSGTADYNESEIASPPSFAIDLNISDSTKTCAQSSLHFDPRIEFNNGLVSGFYKVTNIGDFNVSMHEINGTEFAHVDFDDTVDSQRFITPFIRQIKVVPHHFGLDGNFTNRSNGFTYLSNFEDYNTSESRIISAVLDLNITAQAVDNNTTSNYTESCYAKDGNVTMTLANALIINPIGSLTKMLWYDQNHDINGSIALAGTTYSMDMNATQFDSVDVNGTARVKYLINFDRDEKLVVDPLTMTINQATATDTDTVSGTKVLNTNNSANYVYGRIVPRDIRVFGANTPFVANGWYEVYNASTLNATSLQASKNESMWYINSLHNDLNDGDGNVTVVNTTTVNIGGPVGIDGIEDYNFGNTYGLGGYKAHINTDPWLWYGINALGYADPGMNVNGTVDTTVNADDCQNHPCFNINIVPPIGATGSAKSTNESTKDSKASTRGGTGWHSTTDYAPAIR